jgi:hypothetical protein
MCIACMLELLLAERRYETYLLTIRERFRHSGYIRFTSRPGVPCPSEVQEDRNIDILACAQSSFILLVSEISRQD